MFFGALENKKLLVCAVDISSFELVCLSFFYEFGTLWHGVQQSGSTDALCILKLSFAHEFRSWVVKILI